MSTPVDELFGGQGPAAPEPDRLRGLVWLLVGSMAISFVCPVILAWEMARITATGVPDWGAVLLFLTVPAAIGVLWVWQRADEERDRSAAAGDMRARTRAHRLRQLAYLGLLYCLVSMMVQGWELGSLLAEATPDGG